MPYVGRGPVKSGAFRILDDVSGSFNGSTTSFALTVGNTALTIGLPETLLISITGVIQEPGTAFTISGSNIVFASAPAADATFWGVELGDVGGVAATVSANTVDTSQLVDDAVTYAKIQNLGTADRVLGSVSTGVIGEVQIVPDMLATNAVTNIKVATGIDAIKLADGTVTNAELQYINSLSSNAQTQLDAKLTSSTKIDDLTAGDDNTDLDSSTSRHGLLLKLGGGTTNFLRADGAWAAAGGASIASGNFSGDAEPDLSITGLGFSPVLVMISKRCASATCGESMAIAWKNAIEGAGGSGDGRSGTWWAGYNTSNTPKWEDDGIRSVDADGFTVGNTSVNYLTLNGSGNVYTWVAIG